MMLARDYSGSKSAQPFWIKKYLASHINSRASLPNQSAGLLYFEQATGMLRTVYAPEVTVSNTTGCVTEVDVASSTECIGLTLGPAALKVLPSIVTQASMMPSWAITGAGPSVLDIPALTQALIDVSPIGDPLKIGLVPVALAIPFSNALTLTSPTPIISLFWRRVTGQRQSSGPI